LSLLSKTKTQNEKSKVGLLWSTLTHQPYFEMTNQKRLMLYFILIIKVSQLPETGIMVDFSCAKLQLII